MLDKLQKEVIKGFFKFLNFLQNIVNFLPIPYQYNSKPAKLISIFEVSSTEYKKKLIFNSNC